MLRIVVCISLLTIIASCSNVEYLNAPPNDVDPVSEIPEFLWGYYDVDYEMTSKMHEKMLGKEDYELMKHSKPILKIERDRFYYYNQRFAYFTQDTAAYYYADFEIIDGNVYKDGERRNIGPTFETSRGIGYCTRYDSLEFGVANDSSMFKIMEGYITYSMKIADSYTWGSVILLYDGSGLTELGFSAMDKEGKEEKLKSICEVEEKRSGIFDRSTYIIDVNKDQMRRVVTEVYEPFFFLKKVE